MTRLTRQGGALNESGAEGATGSTGESADAQSPEEGASPEGGAAGGLDFGPSAGFDAIANGGTATNADPASPQPEPEAVYATWRDVADAVESGKLEGEGFLPSGTGAVADPYIIKTPEALAWFACLRPQAAARLAADIDLTSATYAEGGAAPAWPGDATLTGSLDGDGHAVLFATTGAGLFAEIAETGSASWLYLGRTDRQAAEAAEQGKPATAVTTTNTRAGALAGTNKGAVTGVVNRMDVSVTNDTDVPANQKPADPSAQAFAGGIVAVNDGTIADCANLGSVANAREAGQSAAAGIAAAGTGTIATSYNAGNVSAQAAAPLAAPFARDAQAYATAVDAASAYLADATYQGIAEQHAALAAEAAGAETPALDAAALAAASERLNAGREGDAAVWSAAGQDMRDFPAPAKPADPGTNVVSQTVDAAAPEATLKSETVETEPVARNGAPIRAKSVASWQVPDASQYAYAPFVVESPEVQGRQLAVSGADALSNMTAEAAAAVLLPKELVVEVAEEEEPQLVGPIVLDGATDPSNAANAAPGESGTPVVQNGEENTAGAQGSANQNAPPTTTETVPVTWTSADYDQATAAAQGTTFTAQLPAGYRLADGATPLAITVVPADQAGENAGAMPSDNDAAVVESWRLPTEEEGYDLASAAEATDQGITLALTDLSALADLSAEEAIAQLLPAQVRATVQVPGSANDAADAPATTITSESHIFDSANPDSDRNAASGETQEVALDVAWTATSYDNPAANGATFTAQLPEGYQLADGVTPLVVTVPPSEAATLDTAYSTWQEVGAAVEAGSITATASGQGSVKPTNIDEPDAGAAGNPYLINSPEALAWFMNKANADAAYRAKHVKLTADIDLTGSTYGGTPAEPLRWVAIGSQNAKYTGAFDGNGKTIDYMRILFTTETGVQGLFGYGGPGSVIKNVTVGSHSSVTSAGSDLAGIVGWLENGTVQNCRNEASVTTTAAGRGSHIAGIVGWGAVATIIGCVNAGDVTSLTGSPSYIGGIGGLGQWIVRDCYNIGTVRCDNSSDPKVSGICSGNNTSTDTCIIENSYNAGTLSAKNSSRTFGISVNTYAQVANCYYLGTSNAPAHGTSVTADQLATWGMPFLLNGRSVDGPWTVDDAASPANASRPVLALNLDGTAKNELPEAADWAEVGKWVNDFDPEYASGKKHKPEGNGTDDNPYRITTPEGLAWFAYATNAGKLGPTTTKKSAVIEADLDLTGAAYHRGSGALEWVPIGIGDVIYYGTFDGQGHAISNLSVTKLSDAVRYGPDGTDQNIKVAGLFGNAGSADVYLNNTFNNIVLESGSVGGDLAGVAADVPVFGGAVVGLFDGYAFGLKNRGVDVTFTLATLPPGR